MRRAVNKTRKAAAKRFKVTGTGKVMRSHAGRRHLLATKNAKRRRRLRQDAQLPPGDADRILEALPFSR